MISFFTFYLSFFVCWPTLNLGLPVNPPNGDDLVFVQNKRGFELPIQRRTLLKKRGTVSAITGLGDFLDSYGPGPNGYATDD